MKKNFSELSKEGFISEKENAIEALFLQVKTYNYPPDLQYVNSVEELKREIDNGYNPDEHFSFYSDGYDVDVKIG